MLEIVVAIATGNKPEKRKKMHGLAVLLFSSLVFRVPYLSELYRTYKF